MLNQQIQNYKIISLLGEGGMAKVYLAEHVIQHNRVAIKVLNEEFLHDRNIRRRFIEEAKSLANLEHKNIIKVIDTYNEDDFVAFVMEYVEGETLKEYIERKGELKEEEISAEKKFSIDEENKKVDKILQVLRNFCIQLKDYEWPFE